MAVNFTAGLPVAEMYKQDFIQSIQLSSVTPAISVGFGWCAAASAPGRIQGDSQK
jgi:hypothetical protein